MSLKESKRIIRRRETLEKRLDKIKEDLKDLQAECPHHNLRYRYGGTSGNYDGYEAYWSDWYCPDCQKRWHAGNKSELEEELYKRYPHAKQICRYNNSKKYKNFYNYELLKEGE